MPDAPLSSRVQDTPGCLRNALMMALSIVLGAALALLILLGINGSLYLNDSDKTTYLELNQSALQTGLDKLSAQMNAQHEAVATLQAQSQGLDGGMQRLAGQVQSLSADQQQNAEALDALQASVDEMVKDARALQQQTASLRQQQDDMQEQIAELGDDLDDAQEQIARIGSAADRFDQFVTGMITLMAEVSPEGKGAATPAASAAPAATPQAQSSPAPAAGLTPTATFTPTIASSPFITVTATVTPTPTPTPTPTATPSALTLFPPRRPLPTPVPGRSSIYGLVWLDANGNAHPDAGETALPGMRIALQDSDGHTILSMITGVDGRFAFINLPPQSYQVLPLPAGADDLNAPAPIVVETTSAASIEVNLPFTRP